MDADARPGAFGQGVREALADAAGPVDEGLEGDGVACGGDGLEHGGEDLVAVAVGGDLVAGFDGRAEDGADGAAELLVAGVVDGVGLVVDAFFPA